jgi:lysophospholipase L1-like esterase
LSTAVVTRAPAVDAAIALAVAAGRKPIVHLMIGTNDFRTGAGTAASVSATVATLGDRWRALGAKFIIGTVLPCTAVGANALRNGYNTIVRGYVGTHCDAIADYASDPTMGPDAAAANTTYYNADGIHPIDAGHALLAPYFSAAVNSL